MNRRCSSALGMIGLTLLTACGGPRESRTAPAAPLAVRLSTNETLIGRPFTLRATVEASAETQIAWPTPGAPRAIWIRNSREDRSEGQHTREWELIALRPGVFTVWTGAVHVVRADGSTASYDVPRLDIAVRTTIGETNSEPRDIAGLERWPDAPLKRLLTALGAVAALALLAALIALALRRRKVSAPAPAELPPHERAMQALRALRARGIPQADGIEAYYVELSAIVRRYLEDAFSLRAPEQTTEEFIRAATTSNRLTLDHQQLVIAFLEQSDLVKFARHLPAPTDMEAALAAAERLVSETMPRPTPNPAPTPSSPA